MNKKEKNQKIENAIRALLKEKDITHMQAISALYGIALHMSSFIQEKGLSDKLFKEIPDQLREIIMISYVVFGQMTDCCMKAKEEIDSDV